MTTSKLQLAPAAKLALFTDSIEVESLETVWVKDEPDPQLLAEGKV